MAKVRVARIAGAVAAIVGVYGVFGLLAYAQGRGWLPMFNLMFLLLWGIVCGLIGRAIGARRGRPAAGFLWGFFLGPLGWLILVLVTPRPPVPVAVVAAPAGFAPLVVAEAMPSKRCPFCAETILAAAIKCKHCGSDLAVAAMNAEG